MNIVPTYTKYILPMWNQEVKYRSDDSKDISLYSSSIYKNYTYVSLTIKKHGYLYNNIYSLWPFKNGTKHQIITTIYYLCLQKMLLNTNLKNI